MSPGLVKYRSLWITLAALLALVGVYALLGFLAVPALVQSVARTQVEKIGRHVDIGKVAFNPFSFEAAIDDFKLTEADGGPLISFAALSVNLQVWSSVWERGAILDSLRLESPDIALIVEKDGSINLAKLAPPSDKPPSSEPSKPPLIRIGALSIEAGRLGIEDRSRPQPFATALSPIEFTLTDFRTDPLADAAAGNAMRLKAVTNAGEELEWSGDFQVQPIGSKGSIAIRKLQAATIAGYLQDQLPVKLVSGVASLSGTYTLTLDPALALDVKLPTITLSRIAIDEKKAPAQSRPPLSLTELGLHDLSFSLAKRELSIPRVTLKGLNADVRRERDGTLNLMRLIPPPAAPVEPAKQSAGPAWRVSVASIELSDSAINGQDLTMQPATQFALRPIALTVKGFSTDAKTLGLSADVGIDRGGRLRAQGDLTLQPLSTQLDLALENFDLFVLQPYLNSMTAAKLQSGVFGVKGKLNYLTNADATTALTFAGDLGVSGVRVSAGASDQDLLKWRDLKLGGIDFSQNPSRLNIEQVLLVEPSASVAIAKDGAINLTQAMAKPGSSAPVTVLAPAKTDPKIEIKPPVAATGTPIPIKVKKIRIADGLLNFVDQSIEPNFGARIDTLSGEITGVSTAPASHATIHLQGKVDKFSPVLIDGEANLFSADQYTEIALSFRNMDLVRFNPYSGRFAGYNISKGKLSTELKYSIQKRVLAAQHHVIVDQLEFGDATGSKQAVPLPVKLAVGLLKDRHGVIDLELPVNGSLDDPSFKIGPIVGKTLVNLLTKAVTAPFSALGRLFGSSGEELAYVDFAPGTERMTLSEAEKVDKLAVALRERPQLKLDIPLTSASQPDSEALAELELERRILEAAKGVSPVDLTPEKAVTTRLRALEKLYSQINKASPKYPDDAAADKQAETQARIRFLEQALTPSLTPDTAALDRLATARADNVQAMLLANPDIAPERLFLTGRRVSALNPDGAVRMELQLQ